MLHTWSHQRNFSFTQNPCGAAESHATHANGECRDLAFTIFQLPLTVGGSWIRKNMRSLLQLSDMGGKKKIVMWRSWREMGYGNNSFWIFSYISGVTQQNVLCSLHVHALYINSITWKYVKKESTSRSQLPSQKHAATKHNYEVIQRQGTD